MLRELAEDETFWVTLAGASTALVIALVVEARDARDNLDRLVLKASRAKREAVMRSHEEIEAWLQRYNGWLDSGGNPPGGIPAALPIPSDDPKAAENADTEAGRILVLVLALWSLGFSLIGSLVASLPIGYPGLLGDIGMAITLAAFLLGAGGLLAATSGRITRSSSFP
jgi:hypothetical protein